MTTLFDRTGGRRMRGAPHNERCCSQRHEGMAVRCVTAQHSVLLRSQLIYGSLCSRTRRYAATIVSTNTERRRSDSVG